VHVNQRSSVLSVSGWSAFKRASLDSLYKAGVGSITLIPTVPFGVGADSEQLAILLINFRFELVNVIVLKMRPAISHQLDFVPALEDAGALAIATKHVVPHSAGEKSVLRTLVWIRDTAIYCLCNQVLKRV
jgi:hypothetical protein